MRTEPSRRAAGRRRVRLAIPLSTATASSVLAAAAAVTTLVAAPGVATAEPRPIHTRVDAPASSDAGMTFDEAFVDDGVDGPSAAVSVLEACPVEGEHEFEDSWGWARSGGRTHQGVDLIAERGTPVVAVRDGELEHTRSSRGGRSAWLITDEGLRFYYAHLDEWIGEERTVEAGDAIGTVGSTGNAHGAHLHFEIRPGRTAINPYVHTVDACGPGDGTETEAGADDPLGRGLIRPV